MSELVNWNRLIKELGIVFVLAFLAELWWERPNLDLPRHEPSWETVRALYGAFAPLGKAAGGALAFTGAVFWLFTTWGWRRRIFRKLNVSTSPIYLAPGMPPPIPPSGSRLQQWWRSSIHFGGFE